MYRGLLYTEADNFDNGVYKCLPQRFLQHHRFPLNPYNASAVLITGCFARTIVYKNVAQRDWVLLKIGRLLPVIHVTDLVFLNQY